MFIEKDGKSTIVIPEKRFAVDPFMERSSKPGKPGNYSVAAIDFGSENLFWDYCN